MRILLVFLIGIGLLGCGASKTSLLRRATFDLSCPEGQLALTKIDQRTQLVQGCGRTATYVAACDGSGMTQCTWALNSAVREVDGPVASSAPSADPIEEARIEEARAKNGAKMIKLYLRGGQDWLLYLSTAPGHDSQQATLFWRISNVYSAHSCEIKLVADGERIEVGATSQPVKNESSIDYKSTLAYPALLQLAAAERVVGKLCDVQLTLSDAHRAKLRELVMRIKETQALEEEPVPSTEPEAGPKEI